MARNPEVKQGGMYPLINRINSRPNHCPVLNRAVSRHIKIFPAKHGSVCLERKSILKVEAAHTLMKLTHYPGELVGIPACLNSR